MSRISLVPSLMLAGVFSILVATECHAEIIALPPVEIQSSNDAAAHARNETAAKLIVPKGDIAKFGDTRLSDVLQRVPGLTVESSQTGVSIVRMRGLAQGYTQILLNGEPVPPGFSIDSISPGLIERIEVLRVGTVDMSTAGIAGTINIVLQKTQSSARQDFKATVSHERGRPSSNLDTLFAGTSEDIQYSLGGNLGTTRVHIASSYDQTVVDPGGNTTLERFTDRGWNNKIHSLSLVPNLTWKPINNESLRFENLLRWQRVSNEAINERTTSVGPPPDLTRDIQQGQNQNSFLRSRITWDQVRDDGSKLVVKVTGTRSSQDYSNELRGADETGVEVLQRNVSSRNVDTTILSSGNFRAPYTVGHALATGWDLEYAKRTEDRVQLERTSGGRSPVNLNEAYTSQVHRLAMFVQDEWDTSPTLSLYLGLRWEGLRTYSDGNVISPIENSSGIVSPVIQTLWKPSEQDRFRLGVSKSSKAPTTLNLISRRHVAIDNTPATPNYQGNGDLRPEVAWGVDLSYEHEFAKASSASVMGFVRRIDDVVLDDLFFINGAWTLMPVNRGRADTGGIEFDTKLSLETLFGGAPPLDARFNATRVWSRVREVPGPNNRLERQTPYSASVGLEYRLSQKPITIGTSYSFTGGGWVRVAETRLSKAPNSQKAEAFLLWKASKLIQTRLAFARQWRSGNGMDEDIYFDTNGLFHQLSSDPAFNTVRLAVEIEM